MSLSLAMIQSDLGLGSGDAPNVVIKGHPPTETDRKIKEYEKERKWSHAAELADKQAEKTKREDLKTRALEDYKKAGYNFDKYDT